MKSVSFKKGIFLMKPPTWACSLLVRTDWLESVRGQRFGGATGFLRHGFESGGPVIMATLMRQIMRTLIQSMVVSRMLDFEINPNGEI